ncbi:MAG: LapA family protein [Gammaproteobacteria bacterium]
MRILTYILLLILMVFGVTFAFLNAQPVEVNYYLATRHIPLSLLLVWVLGSGMLLGFLACFPMYLKQRRSTSKLKKRLKLVEKEIANLRAIPLKDEH